MRRLILWEGPGTLFLSMPSPQRRFSTLALLWVSLASCQNVTATVDLGDNFVAPDLQLDENVFFCRIQPIVLSMQGCASGAAGEGGSCHADRSSLRLRPEAETDVPPTCDGDTPTSPVPQSYMDNLEAVRFTVNSDPLSSPFYRRPIGLDTHPRVIFGEGSAEATLIAEWIADGAS